MVDENLSRHHRHGRLPASVLVLLFTTLALTGLLLLSCRAPTPTPPPVPTYTPQPGPEEVSRLPPFVLDASLRSDIVHNAEQGLGQCHWVDPEIIVNPLVSWAYDSAATSAGWDNIEPEPGVYHWEALDAQIAKARSAGKRIWIEVHTTEGRTPQWAIDQGVVLVGSRGGTPVPWNETYHRLLRRVVHAMAARYDGNPTVDAVNVMAGGCYGEMAICAKSTDTRAWEEAGYTDENYVESAKRLVDIYLEEEYTWEDGSKTHGFLQTPVVLQLGAGLYERTLPVIQPVVEYLGPKYGMRVWFKYNGLGGGFEMRWVYQDYDTVTRCGYEPMGNSLDFLDRPKYYVRMALDHHSSYVCLQSPYFDIDDPEWQEAREMAARYLGAQVILQGTQAPDTVVLGHQHRFTTTWVNRGTVPPMRPERVGVKDVPSSYDIKIAFVDPATGVSVFEHVFTPSVPTTQWYSAQPVVIVRDITIPSGVPVGAYDLRLALVDPSRPAEHPYHHFRLVNTDLHDGSGRYTVGQIAVSSGTAPTATPTDVPGPSSPNLPPALFVMLDWMNGDWGNPDYRFSYIDKWGYRQDYRGHPEYGALGGWAAFRWDDLNPQKGLYNWSKTDQYIKDAQGMKVTLPDGSVIDKPVGIAIETWAMEETDTQIGVNYSPYWIAAEGGGAIGSCYDPDGASGPCKPFCTPRFSNTAWQYWFDQFILAMGQHYDNNPEFHNLAFVLIATGVDEETSERKSLGDCAYDTGGNTRAFDDWVLHVMGTYNLAFPNTVHFVQSTLHGIHIHAEHAASFPSRMTGVKVNGLEVDVPSAEVRLDGVLVGGVTGFSEAWHESIPTGFEPKHGNGIEGSYWFYMQGLSVYPYMFDMQLPNLEDAYKSEQQTGFPLQDFVRTHLGRTVQNTPDVWIVLRDTYFQDTTWTGSDGVVRTYGPHHGDLEYWLYRRDSAPGSATQRLMAEILKRELPSPASEHVYGWHSGRRTDQATGNPYMSFDVDDRYPHVGQVPKAAGGQVSWHITITLVNKGMDTFSLEYEDYYGNVVERAVTKGSELGTVNEWVDYTWRVDDAYFGNGLPGGMDFRIDCNDDGDEIIHRLIVRGDGPPPPTPTATRTLPPTRTPTRTTTPATATPTRTRTPTGAPTATPTAPLGPTPTTGPSPTPTRTPTLFPGGQNVVTLQQGLRGYQGTYDTYMLRWSPAQNYGNQANVAVKNDGVYSGLLRFDLGSLPPGSTINNATLALYAYNRDKDQPFELQIYRLLRPWLDLQATWDRASIGSPWAEPGAAGLGTDREATAVASQAVSLVNTWYEMDITGLVRGWAADPQSNRGVLLGGRGDISVVYHIASANHSTPSLRPILIVDYTAPGPTATPTETRAATQTATPSGTPEPSPTATATAVASPTSTETPLPSPSPTMTVTPTAPRTPFPGGHNILTLQQGVRGYEGTNDTYITAWSPTSNVVHQANLMVKNDSVYSGLLRFDLSSMPTGSVVNQATLRVYAYNRDNAGTFDLEAYRLLRPWLDAEATWNQAAKDRPWGVPGANDTVTDRNPNPAAVVTVSAINAWYDLDITELARDWTVDTAGNNGVALRGFGPLSLLYHFASANHPLISLHPQLVIDYTAPVVPTPTPVTPTATGTPTLSATPGMSPTATATSTPSSTATPSPTPVVERTPGLEEQIEEMERRAGILEQLIRAIIDILKRASRIGR